MTLTAGDAGSSNIVDNGSGSLVQLGETFNPSLDFGFTPVYALGNRVWYDTDNDRVRDGTEVGVSGVTVQLALASAPAAILDTQTTDGDGYYLFNGLDAGDYIVIIPATAFDQTTDPLYGYWSSGISFDGSGSIAEIAPTDPDDNSDVDDNGARQLDTSIRSGVVTLGPAFDEPTDDDDLAAAGQGQPDAQANMTVDFGFYTISLGSRVWNDVNDNGLDDVETGINGVEVRLYRADSLGNPVGLPIDTVITSGAGEYSFEGLAQGSYVVVLPEDNFLGAGALRDNYSSVGGGTYEPDAPAPDLVTTDLDDNGQEIGGLGFSGGYVTSDAFNLTPALEQSTDNALGLTLEPRVDFGFTENPQLNLSIEKTEVPAKAYYIAGETTTYKIVVTNEGPSDAVDVTIADAIPLDVSSNPLISSWGWTCVMAGGATGCDTYTGSGGFSDTVYMPVGSTITYTVEANVSGTATGILLNTASVSHPLDNDPGDNDDDDSNSPASLVVSKTDHLDTVAPGSILIYEIVVENNGAVDLTTITVTDTLPADVTYQSASPAPSSAPASGTSGGVVTWTGVSLASGLDTTFTVTVQVNAEPSASNIINQVEVEDSTTNVGDDDDDTDLIAANNGKLILGTNEGTTTLPQVGIGEIVTYQVSIDVPAGGTLTNLRAVDMLDFGLAFVQCVRIDGGALETNYGQIVPATFTSDFSPICDDPANPLVMAEPVGDPSLANQGRRIQFNFGNVRNNGLTDARLIVEYEVVVLDILENENGVSGLNNTIDWNWDGGTLTASSPALEIVEPEMDIDKSATPVVAPYGSTVTFTLDIAHTLDSTADAYDVVVTDILPPGLSFIPGTVSVEGLPFTSVDYVVTPLTFIWDVFPLGQTATITFQTTFVGPAPVVNTSNVAWTSMPIDPGLDYQQSDYNQYSTERWYDPADSTGLNTYGNESSISISIPSLPATGFAPGRVTSLPAQTAEKAYAAMDGMWIEIPALGLTMPITGVPITKDGWDLTWLSNQAGYLDGTTYPGQVGTTGITGHVTLADGTPGPFTNLGKLYWGNQVIMHASGYRYVYEVRDQRTVLPRDLSVFKQDGYTWMTLITCEGYVPWLDTYNYRLAVRAVLLSVEPDTAVSPFASQQPAWRESGR